MVGCGGASAHGLPIAGINKVNVSCVKIKSIKQKKKKKKLNLPKPLLAKLQPFFVDVTITT